MIFMTMFNLFAGVLATYFLIDTRKIDSRSYRTLIAGLAAMNFIIVGGDVARMAERKKHKAAESAAFVGPLLPTTPTDNVQGKR